MSKKWSWKARAAVLAAGGFTTYAVVDYGLHPRPSSEVVDDLLLTKPATERKERLIVLGSGWGAVALLDKIDPFKYEVICISPRNHFVMTPLLPSVTVGTIETRTVVESIRSICPHVKFIEAECTGLNPQGKTLTFTSSKRPSSSREVQDSAKTRPEFQMAYDKLVVAVGAENNTFNTPGVEQHAHFLKEIIDARRIRAAIVDAFESACNPAQTEEERKRLLNFVVVGGGPTGVEFAAELADLLHEDLTKSFPKLKNDVKIRLIEATDKVLGMFDSKVSAFTAQTFEKEGIEVLANTFVKEVKQKEVLVQKKGSKEIESIPSSVVVWATGIRSRPITNKIRECIGVKEQTNPRALLTDGFLRVRGADGVYAMGDCATIDGKPLPATAQVASQEGKYLSKYLNGLPTAHEDSSVLNAVRKMYWKVAGGFTSEPFEYAHRGSLAYTGGDSAAADFKGAMNGFFDSIGMSVMTGKATNILWRSFYMSEQLSMRTKALLAVDWAKAKVFGRDFSRY
ncbi:hypothetical protein GUITHDRAFT_150973 [Guillardia theta CCMP2712]|uniref:Uncharacterized protein n=1 Tax=Guillardia theta (strain CCMP2712) TaxID=905079 RepID=L1JS90_GUITC|nr:hypothetical protein GUITHDRAFT_150973 [Guillardia theta CCMP2712]EKX51060.1 hypothetical protein GUITHDRAFT_150973 [Guillardia theta CCMP2712]|eukprot:XP_005838040.1 hypothetical protein GUITHDRAFT_150973 [Guillardia theta CCMP2712]